jgi:hypothetical protein
VGAASSRDHLISRLEAAPTGVFFMVTYGGLALSCIMHMQILNILQCIKLWDACLKLKYGGVAKFLDVMMKCGILENCGLAV